MIEIVINYSKEDNKFKIYEPVTDTLLISSSLTEALVNLSGYLMSSGMISGDILNYPDISYHLDSATLQEIVKSNVTLMQRLREAPSGFTIASQKFGGSTQRSMSSSKNKAPNFKDSEFYKEGKKFSRRQTSEFSGNSGFKKSNKKFGRK